MICPLCAFGNYSEFHRDARLSYRQCPCCKLVYVPVAERLSAEAEKAEYDLHQNDCDDPGYRRFLSRLSHPLIERLQPGASGLDFGCGPAPALAAMLNDAGYVMSHYDPFYADCPTALTRRYDVITASEVVEHLHQPGEELDRLWSLLRPRGWLGIMTKRVIDRQAFSRWHYKNDPTHVCFFSEATFNWLGAHWGSAALFVDKDVVLFQKPPDE